MKKINPKLIKYRIRIQRKKSKELIRAAVSKKHRNRNIPGVKQYKKYRNQLRTFRRKLLTNLHHEYSYSKGVQLIPIENEIGIESPAAIENYLKITPEIIDFDTKTLLLDLQKCTQVWPSAVTMFCSLKEWAEFSRKYGNNNQPNIASNDAAVNDVNAYLDQCGFYDYVGREGSQHPITYPREHIVEIRREKEKSNVEGRENEIVELLKKTTSFSSDEIELFNSIVLTEAFLNVQEHGVVCNDQGWWVLAQYHKTHKLISLNIADNGIGFRHSLATGPQKNDVLNKLDNNPKLDHEFIEMAIEENTSGAFNATSKKRSLMRSMYLRGSRRGNGLQRIQKTCIDLGIEFSILSHYGYVFWDSKGKKVKSGSTSKRIFGGTLYHFNIPGGVKNENN